MIPLVLLCAAASAAPDAGGVVVDRDGALGYQVRFRDRPVIETSRLGIVVDKVDLAQAARIGKVDRSSGDGEGTYQAVMGDPSPGPRAEDVAGPRG